MVTQCYKQLARIIKHVLNPAEDPCVCHEMDHLFESIFFPHSGYDLLEHASAAMLGGGVIHRALADSERKGMHSLFRSSWSSSPFDLAPKIDFTVQVRSVDNGR